MTNINKDEWGFIATKTKLATEKQRGMIGHLLSHLKREQLGIPKVMRGTCDYSGSILDAVLAQSDRCIVSILISELQDGRDDDVLLLLNQLGYFDAIDRANAEAAPDAHASATAMQSAT